MDKITKYINKVQKYSIIIYNSYNQNEILFKRCLQMKKVLKRQIFSYIVNIRQTLVNKISGNEAEKCIH